MPTEIKPTHLCTLFLLILSLTLVATPSLSAQITYPGVDDGPGETSPPVTTAPPNTPASQQDATVPPATDLDLNSEGLNEATVHPPHEAAPASNAAEVAVSPLRFCESEVENRAQLVLLDLPEDGSWDSAPESEQVAPDTDNYVPSAYIRGNRAAQHAREVVLSMLPMRRFEIIHAKVTAPFEFKSKASLSIARAEQLLQTDPVAQKSIACAEWLIAPHASRGEARWIRYSKERWVRRSPGAKPVKINEWHWRMEVPVTLMLDVYERQGSDTAAGFVYRETLLGNSNATGAHSTEFDDALNWSDIAELYTHISTDQSAACEDRNCERGLERQFGIDGIAAPGPNQSEGHYCQGIDSRVHCSHNERQRLGVCAIRSASEVAAVDLKLQMRNFWPITETLKSGPTYDESGLILLSRGQAEGLKRGSYFLAYPDNDKHVSIDDSLGFARVMYLGAGGDSGTDTPSRLALKAGSCNTAKSWQELSLFGYRVGAGIATTLMLDAGDLETTVALGPELRFTKDISPLLDYWSGCRSSMRFGSAGRRGYCSETASRTSGSFTSPASSKGCATWAAD